MQRKSAWLRHRCHVKVVASLALLLLCRFVIFGRSLLTRGSQPYDEVGTTGARSGGAALHGSNIEHANAGN